MDNYNNIEQLKDFIMESRNPYVLTGAGISTESGIPDFRSKDGLWNTIDPMEYSTRQVLITSPKKFYQYGFPRFRDLLDKKPNQGHYALTELERKGIIKGIITQNIDGLHQKSGSKNVVEVHGSTKTCHCLECFSEYPFSEIVNQLEGYNKELPVCSSCSGILRPDIVLFGDSMPEEFFEIAEVLKKQCDLLIVVGTSLQVYPVAALAELVDSLIIINLDETPFDLQAEVVINDSCGETLSKLKELIIKNLY
ncbi:NAD-dependent protein deacylase [Natranaerobius trueperi]|uniref:protein acetyllysine N-acetyltransferase n=1 Tax=Natranaerobius trueperi TaxID=759412 RepID=A0A226C1P9_9FIRM|nr:NAD-dependent protein deacylase [Natranaerobius trueperi]OWZ84524.1 NAD-dependent protein deacylase [Natranaerobius trueperi]